MTDEDLGPHVDSRTLPDQQATGGENEAIRVLVERLVTKWRAEAVVKDGSMTFVNYAYYNCAEEIVAVLDALRPTCVNGRHYSATSDAVCYCGQRHAPDLDESRWESIEEIFSSPRLTSELSRLVAISAIVNSRLALTESEISHGQEIARRLGLMRDEDQSPAAGEAQGSDAVPTQPDAENRKD